VSIRFASTSVHPHRAEAPSFARTILHQSKKISIHLEKLLDKPQIAYGSESLTEAHANLSGEQALPVGYALLRDLFFVLRDLRATRAASEEFQWERALDADRVVVSIHFFQSTESQRRVFPEARLCQISFRHGDLLTFRQQGGLEAKARVTSSSSVAPPLRSTKSLAGRGWASCAESDEPANAAVINNHTRYLQSTRFMILTSRCC